MHQNHFTKAAWKIGRTLHKTTEIKSLWKKKHKIKFASSIWKWFPGWHVEYLDVHVEEKKGTAENKSMGYSVTLETSM